MKTHKPKVLKPLIVPSSKSKNEPVKKSKVVKETKTDNRSDKLLKLEAELNKKFGENSIQLGFPKDEKGDLKTFVRIPTGSISLDIALGGGIPEGRFTEMSGDFSVGKTTQAIMTLVNAQKLGYVCALIDAEGTSDKEYLEYLGVDTSHLYYSRPDGLEEATQMLIDLQRSGEVHFAVWDSIEASPPMREYEKDFDETMQIGIKPRLLGEYFRKFQASNNRLVREGKRPFTLLALNQLRDKIGKYGDPEYTPGGRAKNFTKSVDIRLRRGDWITEGKGDNKFITGLVVKFKIEKNKTYKRMQVGEFDFYTDENNSSGIPALHNDTCKEIVTECVRWGLIERSGAWFTPKDMDTKFQGLDRVIDFFRGNPEKVEDYRAKILQLTAKGDL